MPHQIARHEGRYVPADHPHAVVEEISGELRRVSMTSVVAAGVDDNGQPVVQRHEAVDHVPVEHLDDYVTDARTRWQSVTVGDVHDSGPGGDRQHWKD